MPADPVLKAKYESEGYQVVPGTRLMSKPVALPSTAAEATEALKNARVERSYTNRDGIKITLHESSNLSWLNPAQKAYIRFAGALHRVTGTQFDVHDTLKFAGSDGFFDRETGTVHLCLDATSFGGTVAHELTHYIEKMNPEGYRAVTDFCREQADKHERDGWSKYIERKTEEYGAEQAESEAVASMMEGVLSDGTAIREFCQRDMTTGRKILEFFSDLLDELKKVFANDQNALESHWVKDTQRQIELWTRALEGTAKAAEQQSLPQGKGGAAQSDYRIEDRGNEIRVVSDLPQYESTGGVVVKYVPERNEWETKVWREYTGYDDITQDTPVDYRKREDAMAAARTWLENAPQQEDAPGEPGDVQLKMRQYQTTTADGDALITRETVAAVQSIGRKSVNAFSSKDVQKAEPFARRYWRGMGVKSPFFRAWFGDWREHDRMPVAIVDVNSNMIEPSDVPRGEMQNDDTGWGIMSSRDGIDETANKEGKASVAYHALSDLEKLIRNAVLLDTQSVSHPSKRMGGDAVFTHTLYTVAKSSGADSDGLFKITVVEYRQNDSASKKFYLLRTMKIPLGGVGSVANTNTHSRDPNASSSGTTTVSDLFALVKRFDKDFNPKPVNSSLLNEDGTPRLVYHGTDYRFTAFKPRDGNNEYFFSDDINAARDYGGIQMPVYLSMKNPYVVNLHGEGDAVIYDALDYAISNGYDGVIAQNAYDGANEHTEYVVFNPMQIKSAKDNIGTFDGTNPDIRYRLRPALQQGQAQLEGLTPERAQALVAGIRSVGGRAFTDPIRLLDRFAKGNPQLRQTLYELIEKPFNEAGGGYGRQFQARYDTYVKQMKELGIGKKESRAMQRYVEGKYQDKYSEMHDTQASCCIRSSPIPGGTLSRPRISRGACTTSTSTSSTRCWRALLLLRRLPAAVFWPRGSGNRFPPAIPPHNQTFCA